MGEANEMDPRRRGIDDLPRDLLRHRQLVAPANNEPHLRAIDHLGALLQGSSADETIVAKLARCWRDRFFNAFYERPLLLLAAMRHDALMEGPKHPLARGFADVSPDATEVTRDRVRAALAPERFSLWIALTTRRVQTNEVSRAVAWLWPAHIAGCSGGQRPLALVDVGASAGLNLVADALDQFWTNTAGATIPIVNGVDCVARIGFDTHPLDIRYDDDLTWLRACVWPGEAERLARLDDAAAAMREAYERGGRRDAAVTRPQLQALNCGLVPMRLEALAAQLPSDALVLVYQTFTRAYLEPKRQATYVKGMRDWLASRPPGSALWVECEIAEQDGASEALVQGRGPQLAAQEFPAEILAHVGTRSGEVRSRRLARCGYHPKALQVDEQAVYELAQRLRSMGTPPLSERR